MNQYISNSMLTGSTTIDGRHALNRLTALWALSEAALGGLLHAFKVPFTGLFIGSSAVILITLIAYFSERPETILKSTIIVMVVKGLVSPHTPITAYFAVAIQGIMGTLFFRFIKNYAVAAFMLGLMALLLSAFQKVIITTLVFGMHIWKSIDLLGNYIARQMMIAADSGTSIQFSFILILGYTALHVTAGILVGIAAPLIAKKIKAEMQENRSRQLARFNKQVNGMRITKKKKGFLGKLSGYMIFLLAFVIIVLSYFFPVFDESQGLAALIMILRSIFIMGIWYFWLAPLVLKKMRRYLARKENQYTREIHGIIDTLPLFKQIVSYSWQNGKKDKGLARWKRTLILILTLSLTYDEEQIIPGESA